MDRKYPIGHDPFFSLGKVVDLLSSVGAPRGLMRRDDTHPYRVPKCAYYEVLPWPQKFLRPLLMADWGPPRLVSDWATLSRKPSLRRDV